ncbi:hypothetical protein U1Q18_003006 [Sarracenia purpurea var. burkii]
MKGDRRRCDHTERVWGTPLLSLLPLIRRRNHWHRGRTQDSKDLQDVLWRRCRPLDPCGFSVPSSGSVVTSFMKGMRRIEGLTTRDGVRSNSSLIAIIVAIDGAGVTSGALEAS